MPTSLPNAENPLLPWSDEDLSLFGPSVDLAPLNIQKWLHGLAMIGVSEEDFCFTGRLLDDGPVLGFNLTTSPADLK